MTVKATTGTTGTYSVNTTSQIEVNGQSAALSDVKVGDAVLVHVYPASSGTMLVERLFDGDLPADGFGAPPSSTGGSSSTGSIGTGSTTSTSTAT